MVTFGLDYIWQKQEHKQRSGLGKAKNSETWMLLDIKADTGV